jgi:hypothetical protein
MRDQRPTCENCGVRDLHATIIEDWPGVHEMIYKCSRCGHEQGGWIACHHDPDLTKFPQSWQEGEVVLWGEDGRDAFRMPIEDRSFGTMQSRTQSKQSAGLRRIARILAYGALPTAISVVLTFLLTHSA